MISGEPRRTVETCLQLDVRAPGVRAAVAHAGVGQWQWSSGEVVAYAVRGDVLALLLPGGEQRGQAIRLERTACRFGGWRRWFRCPSATCGRRCAVLYWPPGGEAFACRSCWGLTYRSRLLTPSDRLYLRRDRVVARLGPVRPGDVPPKPRGMQWRTYGRIRAQAEELADRALIAAARRLGFR